jgi:folylpolyglutamate synthase/dihydropteroate synthase
MDMAADVAGVGDLVLVAGSLYLAAEAREHTGRLEV